jgi:hypothetical protein
MEKQDLIPTIITDILELEKYSDKEVLVLGDFQLVRDLHKEIVKCMNDIEPQLKENYIIYHNRYIREMQSIKRKDFPVKNLEDLMIWS